MKASMVDMDIVERCRQSRRDIERQYKTLSEFGEYLQKLDKKRSKNIAMARKLLAERDATRKGSASAPSRRNKTAVSRTRQRSAANRST